MATLSFLNEKRGLLAHEKAPCTFVCVWFFFRVVPRATLHLVFRERRDLSRFFQKKTLCNGCFIIIGLWIFHMDGGEEAQGIKGKKEIERSVFIFNLCLGNLFPLLSSLVSFTPTDHDCFSFLNKKEKGVLGSSLASVIGSEIGDCWWWKRSYSYT